MPKQPDRPNLEALRRAAKWIPPVLVQYGRFTAELLGGHTSHSCQTFVLCKCDTCKLDSVNGGITTLDDFYEHAADKRLPKDIVQQDAVCRRAVLVIGDGMPELSFGEYAMARAIKCGGELLVNRHICIYWWDTPLPFNGKIYGTWFPADVKRFFKETGEYLVRYSDGSEAMIFLPSTFIHFHRIPPEPGQAPRSLKTLHAMLVLPRVPQIKAAGSEQSQQSRKPNAEGPQTNKKPRSAGIAGAKAPGPLPPVLPANSTDEEAATARTWAAKPDPSATSGSLVASVKAFVSSPKETTEGAQISGTPLKKRKRLRQNASKGTPPVSVVTTAGEGSDGGGRAWPHDQAEELMDSPPAYLPSKTRAGRAALAAVRLEEKDGPCSPPARTTSTHQDKAAAQCECRSNIGVEIAGGDTIARCCEQPSDVAGLVDAGATNGPLDDHPSAVAEMADVGANGLSGLVDDHCSDAGEVAGNHGASEAFDGHPSDVGEMAGNQGASDGLSDHPSDAGEVAGDQGASEVLGDHRSDVGAVAAGGDVSEVPSGSGRQAVQQEPKSAVAEAEEAARQAMQLSITPASLPRLPDAPNIAVMCRLMLEVLDSLHAPASAREALFRTLLAMEPHRVQLHYARLQFSCAHGYVADVLNAIEQLTDRQLLAPLHTSQASGLPADTR